MACVLAEEEARREHLVVYLSGAHAYGFPSPDSDLDLKAIHVARTADLVGLAAPAPTFDRAEVVDGVEVDYTSNELGHALAGMLAGNGNFLERVIGRMVAHASGLLDEPDLTRLMSAYEVADAAELVARKRAGERVGLDPVLVEAWRRLDGLLGRLDAAREQSPLPEEPPNVGEVLGFILQHVGCALRGERSRVVRRWRVLQGAPPGLPARAGTFGRPNSRRTNDQNARSSSTISGADDGSHETLRGKTSSRTRESS
jgi:hypothetical protein